jgi:hypothetical protein
MLIGLSAVAVDSAEKVFNVCVGGNAVGIAEGVYSL